MTRNDPKLQELVVAIDRQYSRCLINNPEVLGAKGRSFLRSFNTNSKEVDKHSSPIVAAGSSSINKQKVVLDNGTLWQPSFLEARNGDPQIPTLFPDYFELQSVKNVRTISKQQ